MYACYLNLVNNLIKLYYSHEPYSWTNLNNQMMEKLKYIKMMNRRQAVRTRT